jgi:hypothetical protein
VRAALVAAFCLGFLAYARLAAPGPAPPPAPPPPGGVDVTVTQDGFILRFP